MKTETDHLVTEDHHAFLTPGGLVLIETEALAQHDQEAPTAEDVAAYENALLLSPGEALAIAALVEQHRPFLQARVTELAATFTQIAQAWLDEFAQQAQARCQPEAYWWPQVRNEAHQILTRMITTRSNALLTSWWEQSRRDPQSPPEQQEEVLLRTFKQLYQQTYALPAHQEDQ